MMDQGKEEEPMPAQPEQHQPDESIKILDGEQQKEVNLLAIVAGITSLYLLAMLSLSLGFSARQVAAISLIASGARGESLETILLCIFVGTLGSSMMALRSIIERIANGWELSDGAKLPQQEPKDKFVGKMVLGFLARPFFGASMGFLVYLAVIGGFWIAIRPNSQVEFRPLGLGFLAFLAGLFAKTFLERLKGVFDKIFGSQ